MALKVTQAWLDEAEVRTPGFRDNVDYFESLDLPSCPACGSDLTAIVNYGIVGRTIHLVAATTKFMLCANKKDHQGKYFCQDCRTFFDEDGTAYEQIAPVHPTAREEVESARRLQTAGD